MIFAFLLTKIGRIVASGTVLVLAFVGWLIAHDHKVATRGAEKAVAKIEKANDNATKLGTRAAARSQSDGVRGQRDPTTRND